MAGCRTRLQDTKIFLLSGVDDEERKLLANLIRDLGGMYIDTDSFRTNCTHVVCGKLSRSEKFLGACSMGKWALHPDFIRRSAEHGHWMQEELFEWSNYDSPNIPVDMKTAGSRWRFNREVFQTLPFTDWNVAVVVSGSKKCSVYRRLLACGGAKVYTLKLPVKNIAKVADTLTYIFVNSKTATNLLHLVEYGILCLRPEYIGDYLIKDPTPDPIDYLVQTEDANVTDISVADINDSQLDIGHILSSANTSVFSTPGSDEVLNLLPSSQTPSDGSDSLVRRSRQRLTVTSNHPSRNQTPNSETSEISSSISMEDNNIPLPFQNVKLSLKRQPEEVATVTTRSGKYIQSSEVKSPKKIIDRRSTISSTNNSSPCFQLPGTGDEHVARKRQKNIAISTSATVSHSNEGNNEKNVTLRKITVDDDIDDKSHDVKLLNSGKLENSSQLLEDQKQLVNIPLSLSDAMSLNDQNESAFSKFDIPCKLVNKKKSSVDEVSNLSMPHDNDSEIYSDEKNLPDVDLLHDSNSSKLTKVINTDQMPNTCEEKSHDTTTITTCGKTSNTETAISSSVLLPTDEVQFKTVTKRRNIRVKLVENSVDNSRSQVKTGNINDIGSNSDGLEDLVRGRESPSNTVTTHLVRGRESPSNTVTTHLVRGRESPSNTVTTPNVSTKRKIEEEIVGTKRQKIYDDKFHWLHVVGTFNSFLSVEDTDQRIDETALQFSTSLSGVIHTCLDETSGIQFLLAGLDLFKSSITEKRYPHPATIHLLMNKILMGRNTGELLAKRTFCVLMKLLQLHPPTTIGAISMYNESFVYNKNNEYSDGQDWNFIKSIISDTIHGGVARGNGIYLLRYLVAIIEQNYVFVLQSYKDRANFLQKIRSSMLGLLLWSSLNQIFFNSRCRDLLGYVGEVLVLPMPQEEKSELLRLLMSIMGMAANICYLTENNMTKHPVNTAIFGKNVSAFLHEVAKVINDSLNECLLKETLMALQPSWFCLGVCCYLLGDYDDYLLVEGLPKDSISLRDIVTKYFYLLPKMNSQPTEVKSPHRKRINARSSRPSTPLSPASSKQSSVSQCVTPQKVIPLSPNVSTTPEKERLRMKRMISTVNKKNFKGETPLHTACIKNDVLKLGQWLKVPGVNVNIQDNAGWTPMHEACNHGSTQCVKELLNFVPAKTVEHYFSKDGPRCKKVDLLISNSDGITPLHDAVDNNRQDICLLLLQHAGAVLLKQKTVDGFTPLDLSNDDDITDLLLSFSDDQITGTSSQESSHSQELVPGSHLYEHVLGQDHKERFSSVDECVKYISVISFLINSYITATEVTHLFMSCEDNLTGNKENFNSLPSEKEKLLKSDLKILGNMKKYLMRFEEHLRKICDTKNMERLNMELALLMCIQSNRVVKL